MGKAFPQVNKSYEQSNERRQNQVRTSNRDEPQIASNTHTHARRISLLQILTRAGAEYNNRIPERRPTQAAEGHARLLHIVA
jgi:hypothetical protein